MMVDENAESIAEISPESTDSGDQSYGDVLSGEGDTPTEDAPAVEAPEKVEPPADDKTPEEVVSEEIELALGEETFKGKQESFARALRIMQSLGDEGLTALESAEKLADLKKNYDKGFTQNNQAIAEERKSYEDAFGHKPTTEEIGSLKPIIQAYYSDEVWKGMVDGLLQGKSGQAILSELSKGLTHEDQLNPDDLDPGTKALQDKIGSLEGKLSQVLESIEAKEVADKNANSKRVWDGWVAKRSEQSDFEMSEDIDKEMGPIIRSLLQRNPDWDNAKVLDEAHHRAMILLNPDKVSRTAVNQVLEDADKGKRPKPPKITPKVPQKADSEQSYAEVLLNS